MYFSNDYAEIVVKDINGNIVQRFGNIKGT